MPIFFFTVEQQERAIVERFGKFVRVGGPGLQTKTPFVERVAGRMSLQVEQLNSQIETKTKDNAFVQVKLAVQYKVGVGDQQVQDAYYKLDDPEVQMQSYAFDVVRSHIPTMDLDEAYADADTIAKHIQDTLQTQMADYGYEIIKALITNIEPDQRVKVMRFQTDPTAWTERVTECLCLHKIGTYALQFQAAYPETRNRSAQVAAEICGGPGMIAPLDLAPVYPRFEKPVTFDPQPGLDITAVPHIRPDGAA